MRASSRYWILLPSLLLALSSCRDAAPPAEEEPLDEASALSAAAATITPEEVYSRIGVLAHDSMGGRNTPSPGLEMAAAWAASEFESMGLEPGGDPPGHLTVSETDAKLDVPGSDQAEFALTPPHRVETFDQPTLGRFGIDRDDPVEFAW